MSAARYAVRVARRGLATAAAHPTTASAAAGSAPRAAIPLANLEAQWERMNSEDQVAVHEQLEELQKKNWKELSLAEKKAAYYVSFGPHGPRAPISPPGTTLKVTVGVIGVIAATGVVWAVTRSFAPPPPRTMTKEWQEASNERAKEMRINPISGISSEGYEGKGFVQSDK